MKVFLLFLCLIGWSAAYVIEDLFENENPFNETVMGEDEDPMNETIFSINENAGLDLFEGDIALTASGVVGLINTASRWPNRRVPYTFSTVFSTTEKTTITNALNLINGFLGGCLSYVPRNSEPDYIHITKAGGCWSYVGRIGGVQRLSLESGCIAEYIIHHEFLHAAGMFHEQSRPDRDNFITVVYENIRSGFEGNFNKYGTSFVSTFGTPYDYTSVMHYHDTAFTINGQPTIITKNPAFQKVIGRVFKVSCWDIQRVLRMYGCSPY